jgi:hypothetical protein
MRDRPRERAGPPARLTWAAGLLSRIVIGFAYSRDIPQFPTTIA